MRSAAVWYGSTTPGPIRKDELRSKGIAVPPAWRASFRLRHGSRPSVACRGKAEKRDAERRAIRIRQRQVGGYRHSKGSPGLGDLVLLPGSRFFSAMPCGIKSCMVTRMVWPTWFAFLTCEAQASTDYGVLFYALLCCVALCCAVRGR